MKVLHSWLKDYIGEDIPSAEKIGELLTFHSFEIEGIEQMGNEYIIDVDVLPNRSSDCLSHRGIAREIVTLLNTKLAYDPLQQEISLPQTNMLAVDVQDIDGCTRFTAVVIEDIEVKESPQWLQDRLKAIEQRPINNIVDATNYVMFALGQPMHAYDADKFPITDGMWQFQVRAATKGETIHLLGEGVSEEERVIELLGTETLVVDKSSGTPISLAGIKGGSFAGIDAKTTRVIIESAHWNPATTRKTARRLGLVIESSKRNENNPSSELPPFAQQEIVSLIKNIAGGTCVDSIDVYPTISRNPTVSIDPSRVNALLGITIGIEEMVSILNRVGVKVEKDDSLLTCVGPWERTDLSIEEDFIEEIGRIYGYSHIESIVPETVPLKEYNARHYYSEKVRTLLVDLGFSEVITSTFQNKDQVQLLNALASDKSYLRSSLRKNFESVLDKNIAFTDLLGLQDIRVFEIGTVFEKADTVSEHTTLTLGVRQKQHYTPKDDILLKDIIEDISKALGIEIDVRIEKGIVEINFTLLLETLPAPTAYEIVPESKDIMYRAFSLYPAITRDVALWVKEGTTEEDVATFLTALSGDLCVRTTLFDTFTKEGRTSYAFRLVFQATDRTLTDEEIGKITAKMYAQAEEKGWEPR